MRNVTNQIALLKLGKLPLLYKVGPMAVFWWWAEYFVLLCWSSVPLCIVCVCTCVCERGWGGHREERVSQEDGFSKTERFQLTSLRKKKLMSLLFKTGDALSQVLVSCGILIKLAYSL